jgi:hypothetical protein
MKDLFKYKSKCCNEPIARCQDWYYCTNCLSFVKGLVFHYPLIIGFIILIILSLCSFTAKAPNNKLKTPIDIEQYTILNDSSITNKLLELGCILPNVALAQIKQETGNYTSSLTFTHKNLGGIRIGKKYKKYNNYVDCLKDCIRIQNMYLAQIHKKYAEDTTYIYKLKFIK